MFGVGEYLIWPKSRFEWNGRYLTVASKNRPDPGPICAAATSTRVQRTSLCRLHIVVPVLEAKRGFENFQHPPGYDTLMPDFRKLQLTRWHPLCRMLLRLWLKL